MALHRDIYWIGRQWSVTGYGLQLIDQRLKGVFDIEIAQLRDDRVLEAMRARDWLKAEDFAKAIAAARKRFPEPARPGPGEQSKPVEAPLKLREPVTSILPISPASASLPPPAPGSRTGSEIAEAEFQSKAALAIEKLLRLSEPISPASSYSAAPAMVPPALGAGTESAIAEAGPRSKAALAIEKLLRLSEPGSPAPSNSPDSTTLSPPPALGRRTESEIAEAELQSKAALAVETLLRLSEPVSPASPNAPPLATATFSPPPLGLGAQSELASAESPSEPAMPAETLKPSEPVAPPPIKLPPSTLELRRESERARADLQSKMKALDGLLRSRGFVTPQPVTPQPSILAVQAEGELAKFAPQWRVRN